MSDAHLVQHTGQPSMDAERLDLRHNACASAVEAIRAQSEAEVSMATLGALAAVIAHEFNALLTPMHARAQRVLREPDDAERAEALAHQVLESSQRGQDLIDAVLDLIPHDRQPGQKSPSPGHDQDAATPRADHPSQPPDADSPFHRNQFHGEHGPDRATQRPRPAPTTADEPTPPGPGVILNTALDRVLSSVHVPETVAIERAIPSLSLAMPDAAADQILANLLTNAVRALDRRQRGGNDPEATQTPLRLILLAGVGTPPSMPTLGPLLDPGPVRLADDPPLPNRSTGNSPNTGNGPDPEIVADQVWLIVADTGTGIPRGALEQIFEPIVSLPAVSLPAEDDEHTAHADDARGTGMGLGLFIVRSLLAQFGGTITAHSEPGRGTAFILTLPSAA